MPPFAVLAVTVSPLLSASASPSAQSAPPQNILMIVLDDLGTEQLALYGHSGPFVAPTPNLDALRAQGILFTRAYANPMCSPSRAAFMTGRYAFRTGMGYIAEGHGGVGYTLPDDEIFIPEMLAHGFEQTGVHYTSGAFGKWHLADHEDETTNFDHPLRNGFDRFFGHMANIGDHFHWLLVDAPQSPLTPSWVGSPSGPYSPATWEASVVQARASRWMLNQPGPFFAYVCFSPPHTPHQVPARRYLSPATQQAVTAAGLVPGDQVGESSPSYHACYSWMVEAIDSVIGVMVNGLPAPVRANTTIIVVGDNGSVSNLLPCPLDSWPITGHGKRTTYEYGVRVPLIVSGASVAPENRGATCNGLVSAVDFWSTIADLTGADATASNPPTQDGVSFKHMIDQPTAPSARTYAFTELFDPNGPFTPSATEAPQLRQHIRGITDGVFKYISLYSGGTPAAPGVRGVSASLAWQQGFFLPTDPDELSDLFCDAALCPLPLGAPSCACVPSLPNPCPPCATPPCPVTGPASLAELGVLYEQLVNWSGL
ncbi:MAG: sulfatase [Planctomycetota bacterium]